MYSRITWTCSTTNTNNQKNINMVSGPHKLEILMSPNSHCATYINGLILKGTVDCLFFQNIFGFSKNHLSLFTNYYPFFLWYIDYFLKENFDTQLILLPKIITCSYLRRGTLHFLSKHLKESPHAWKESHDGGYVSIYHQAALVTKQLM